MSRHNKEAIKEAKKVLREIRKMEVLEGVIGYRIFLVDIETYVTFADIKDPQDIELTDDFNNAYIFKSQAHALTTMKLLHDSECRFKLKPIISKAF